MGLVIRKKDQLMHRGLKITEMTEKADKNLEVIMSEV